MKWLAAILTAFIALVVFREKAVYFAMIALAIILILWLIRLIADIYWFGKDNGKW